MLLGIDPGTFESGYVIFDGTRVISADILKNEELRLLIKYESMKGNCTRMAIEMIASYGMPVGAEVFETCVWVGRFMELWQAENHTQAKQVFRKDVKLHLCGTSKAKDANIRQALIDKLGPVGTKKQPGACFGVKSHAWAALAVAVTALEKGMV
jgi:Holliday junction resolvasome RuvABC endonuclease subunit